MFGFGIPVSGFGPAGTTKDMKIMAPKIAFFFCLWHIAADILSTPPHKAKRCDD